MTLRTILLAATILTMLAGFLLTLWGVYHGIHAAGCKRPDAPFHWMVALNPFNAGWFEDQLTNVGLAHRKQALRLQGIALLLWAASAAAGIAFELSR